MEQPSDASLWEEGTAEAFAILFERHARAIHAYCYRRTLDRSGAEDLMAATFLEAWRKRRRVRLSGDSARPWLLGVATNLLRNDRRSVRRRDIALSKIPPPPPRDAMADEVAERVDDWRRLSELHGALSTLPERDREIISLVVWSNLSHEETASALGIPVGTVKSRLSRARAALRAALLERPAPLGHLSVTPAITRAATEPRSTQR